MPDRSRGPAFLHRPRPRRLRCFASAGFVARRIAVSYGESACPFCLGLFALVFSRCVEARSSQFVK